MDRNIVQGIGADSQPPVALRKESVDRNTHTTTTTAAVLPSLSARRAWIEILNVTAAAAAVAVALRKESVDRNKISISACALRAAGRSPQGERG